MGAIVQSFRSGPLMTLNYRKFAASSL